MGEEDAKVKAETEGEEIDFGPDPLSGGATTFTIYHGGFGGSPPSEGALEKVGLGHLSGGYYVQPDPGTPVTFPSKAGGRTKEPPPTVYLAVCFQQHEVGADGVDSNGNWTSGVLADCQSAFAAAQAHEHAVDRVEAITGPVGFPISGC
jgi:hypothetical protein